jgi:hypothetical protein
MVFRLHPSWVEGHPRPRAIDSIIVTAYQQCPLKGQSLFDRIITHEIGEEKIRKLFGTRFHSFKDALDPG